MPTAPPPPARTFHPGVRSDHLTFVGSPPRAATIDRGLGKRRRPIPIPSANGPNAGPTTRKRSPACATRHEVMMSQTPSAIIPSPARRSTQRGIMGGTTGGRRRAWRPRPGVQVRRRMSFGIRGVLSDEGRNAARVRDWRPARKSFVAECGRRAARGRWAALETTRIALQVGPEAPRSRGLRQVSWKPT